MCLKLNFKDKVIRLLFHQDSHTKLLGTQNNFQDQYGGKRVLGHLAPKCQFFVKASNCDFDYAIGFKMLISLLLTISIIHLQF